jgi:hypothetical protein
MSNNNMDNNEEWLNPKRNMDEVEETTRRVGGRGASAPSMISPSFAPMPMSMPVSSMQMPNAFGSMINTAPMKASHVLGLRGQSSANIYVWDLTCAPTLPEFHPLERTAVFVPNSTPSIVAGRVSSALRDRSIEAEYDNDKAKVKCITSEGVNFRVRLYRGRGQYDHGVIVEVQRRFGSSLVFHSDTQAILEAAQGKPMPPPPVMTSMNNLPEVSDDEDDDDDDDYLSPPSADSSLAMVDKMLSLPGFDSQFLGLQTLSSLVDPEKLTLSTARGVSSKLLKTDSSVGHKVFSIIVSRKTDESSMTLRNMTLNIVANSMRSCGTVPEFLREPLRPVLLEDLKDSEKHPNTALLAAKVIEYFIRGDHDATELNEVFEIARKVGESKHANLEHQAQKCIAAIR